MELKNGGNMDNNSEETVAELLTLRKEISKSGTIRYYNKDNQYHRINGPAVIWKTGSKEWWENGNLHRIGAAAIETHYGDRYWYQNDRLHRLDGPAVEFSNGKKEWHIDGQFIRSEPS